METAQTHQTTDQFLLCLSWLSHSKSISIIWRKKKKNNKKHLLLHLHKYNFLHPNQSGFRKKHPCQTALTSLVDQWITNINNDEFSGTSYSLISKRCLMLLITTFFSENQLFVECQTVLWNFLGLTLTTDSNVLMLIPVHLPY